MEGKVLTAECKSTKSERDDEIRKPAFDNYHSNNCFRQEEVPMNAQD